MTRSNQLNTLLMEIMIAVLFFALCSTVIMDVFVGAHNQSVRAGVQAQALAAAQNLSDGLYAAEQREELLLENGFEADESGVFTRECDGYTLSVALGEERTAAGRIETAEITALYRAGSCSACRMRAMCPRRWHGESERIPHRTGSRRR